MNNIGKLLLSIQISVPHSLLAPNTVGIISYRSKRFRYHEVAVFSRRLGLAKVFTLFRDSPLIMLFWDIGQNFGRLAALVLQQTEDVCPNTSIPSTRMSQRIWYSFLQSCIHFLFKLRYLLQKLQILHYNNKPKHYQCKFLIFTFESMKVFILTFDYHKNLNLFPINVVFFLLRFWCDTMNSYKLVIYIAKWNSCLKAKL